MKASLARAWRWARWLLLILVVANFALVAWRILVLEDADKTAEAVAAIHANKLTQEDVYGPLVAAPDQKQSDSTLAGVDANSNGIRDDVERAIYLAHKDSATTTAAMLQYAKELQMEFTRVFNSETLVAVIQEESRGFSCAYGKEEEVENLTFNTEKRKEFREEILKKYMTSYKLPNEDNCDINL